MSEAEMKPAAVRHRRGSALIETALALLLLLLLTLAIVDVGRYLYAANLLPYLAREGARWASLQGDKADPQALERHVRKMVVGLPPESVQVTLELDSQAPAVTVRTRYSFAPATGTVLGRDVPVSGQARLVLPQPAVTNQ